MSLPAWLVYGCKSKADYCSMFDFIVVQGCWCKWEWDDGGCETWYKRRPTLLQLVCVRRDRSEVFPLLGEYSEWQDWNMGTEHNTGWYSQGNNDS